MSTQEEQVITLNESEILEFCGRNDSHLRQIESEVGARLVPRGNEIRVLGPPDEVARAVRVIGELLVVQRSSHVHATPQQIRYAVEAVRAQRPEDIQNVFLDQVAVPSRRKRVAPLNTGQKRYLDAIRENDVVFAIGPAGTGKTYLAVAMAVNALTEGKVRRIVLARPAVEAGERLGFLPGDIAAKFDPFVRPLYDALYDMMEVDKMKDCIERGIIEIVPLAYMRGRTLNSAFVILDEGQNTTVEQMKMFLTRLGGDSKAVVTGDITQIDLPKGRTSGLIHARDILRGISGIAFAQFDERDVVRHALVQKIIRAYETDAKESAAAGSSGNGAEG